MTRLRCRYFGVCGGCQLQDMPYGEQVEWKVRQVSELFGREPDEVHESPKTFYYRNRMDFAVGPGWVVGLKERGKWWSYVDLHECLLMSPEADELKNLFREFIKSRRLQPWDTKRHVGFVRYIVIREGKFTGERMVTVVTYRSEEDHSQTFLDFLQEASDRGIEVSTLYWGINPTVADVSMSKELHLLHGEPYLRERLLGNTYLISPNAFFQSNSYTAEILLDRAVSLLEADGGTVYDLYSGVGTFSVEVAKRTFAVCVESDPEAISLLRENMRLNGVSSYKAINARVEDLSLIEADAALIDPPRAGMHPRAVRALLRSKPKRVVYVSCNPKTQKRDVKPLLKAGYKLTYLVFVDQFPQTVHIETIALLERG